MSAIRFGEVKLKWSTSLGAGDFEWHSPNPSQIDLHQDNGLGSAVLLSLFCDRRAGEDDLVPDLDNQDRRGWWGDLVSEYADAGDQIGSRLWLLERSKATKENAERAKEYIYEALQWLIDDGIAVRVGAETSIEGPPENRWLAMRAEVYRSDGSKVAVAFDNQWRETGEPGYHGD